MKLIGKLEIKRVVDFFSYVGYIEITKHRSEVIYDYEPLTQYFL